MKSPILRIVLSIFLVLFAGFILPIIVIVATGFEEQITQYPFVQHILMFLFSILIALALGKGNLKRYGFQWSLDFPIKKVAFIAISIGLINSVFSDFILKLPIENTPWENWTIMDIIINAWFFASIAEEVLTRGLIQGFMEPFKQKGLHLFGFFLSLPVITGAVLFSLMHLVLLALGADIVLVISVLIVALILGLMAGYHREKTGSLAPAILIHLCYNIGGTILMFLT